MDAVSLVYTWPLAAGVSESFGVVSRFLVHYFSAKKKGTGLLRHPIFQKLLSCVLDAGWTYQKPTSYSLSFRSYPCPSHLQHFTKICHIFVWPNILNSVHPAVRSSSEHSIIISMCICVGDKKNHYTRKNHSWKSWYFAIELTLLFLPH